MEERLTLTIYTEVVTGMLQRLAIVLTRRNLQIISITSSESEQVGLMRYTIILLSNREKVNRVIGQLEKLIDVFRVILHDEEKIVSREIALFKVRVEKDSFTDLNKVINFYQLSVLKQTSTYIILEKTGDMFLHQALLEALRCFGVLEYTRSGYVVVAKNDEEYKVNL